MGERNLQGTDSSSLKGRTEILSILKAVQVILVGRDFSVARGIQLESGCLFGENGQTRGTD